METKPCNTKNTEEMPDCYSQCVALPTAWNAAWFTPLKTHYHTEDSTLLGCGVVTGCGSLDTREDPLTCQDHSPSNTASYPRGPESSAVCCENLKFCRMLLVWQNAECNIYVCNFLKTEHPSFFNV